MVGGLEAVFLTHREALLRFFHARGGGDAADDLLQELWLKASSANCQPVAQPLAYLYRMANNLILDRVRSESRRRSREQNWSDASFVAEDSAASSHSGERILLAREQVKAVEAALSALGGRTETIFRRFRLDGLSQGEIAREEGISLSAVEKHLQKAYKALLQLKDDLDAG